MYTIPIRDESLRTHSTGQPVGLDVSVVVTAEVGSPSLARTVDSVRLQPNPPAEILVVEYTPSRDSAIGLDEVHSLAAARNQALLIARHDCLAFLNVGDLWPVGCLEQHLWALHHHPASEVVLGYTQSVLLQPSGPTPITTLGCHVGAALFRRSAFNRTGLFDETPGSTDMEWFVRARNSRLPVHVRNEVSLLQAVPMLPHADAFIATEDPEAAERRRIKRRKQITLRREP